MVKFKINAGNNVNGNPRRGWVILSDTGELQDFVDEGYQGSGALSQRRYGEVQGDLEIEVKPSVYREMLRLEKA